MKKEAECVRQGALWSKIQRYHRFDKPSFNAAKTQEDMSMAAPKLDALLQKIDALDQRDQKEHGRLFKHMIYTDVKSQGYGAKIVAAALLSRNFHLIFDARFKLQLKQDSAYNMAVLASTPVYERPITVRLRNEILAQYNQRPGNIHGEKVRFIVLDQGYKEGIDLFDVKYVHILEPLISPGDQKQVIGRGTRFCGQKGLRFHPMKGWPLFVYRYDVVIPEKLRSQYRDAVTLSELYIDMLGIDTRNIVLASELERYAIMGAVDHGLTKNIHEFHIHGMPPSTLMTLSPRVKEHLVEMTPLAGEAQSIELYGKRFSRAEAIRCTMGCKGLLPVPTPLLLLVWLATSNKTTPFYLKHPRNSLCNTFMDNRKYCHMVNLAWRNPDEFLEKYEARIQVGFERLAHDPKVVRTHLQGMSSYARGYQQQLNLEKKPPSHLPPSTQMSFWKLQKHVVREFHDLTWGKIDIEDRCHQTRGGDAQKIVRFTPTQNFLRYFLRPSSPYKGMFAYHSVGTGKLCTAIATATSTFEKEGYSILYVTRHTLKADVWKNVFDQVCSVDLQERLTRGEIIPLSKKERMEMLSAAWMEPVSYKQFTNMLLGKNKLYQELVARNGSQDPLRKTFLVIDEVHKLFSPDMGTERADLPTLVKKIQDSYRISKENSVRILVMTATPMAYDPLHLIRILNLLREPEQQIPDTLETFAPPYLDGEGRFTPKGAARFLNQIAGYISYLNREKDVRQFAYPVLEDVLVPLTASPSSQLTQQIEAAQVGLQESQEMLARLGPVFARKLRVEYDQRMADCAQEPTKTRATGCKQEAKAAWQNARADLDAQKMVTKTTRDNLKKQLQQMKQQVKVAESNDLSQHFLLPRSCTLNAKNQAS